MGHMEGAQRVLKNVVSQKGPSNPEPGQAKPKNPFSCMLLVSKKLNQAVGSTKKPDTGEQILPKCPGGLLDGNLESPSGVLCFWSPLCLFPIVAVTVVLLSLVRNRWAQV